MGFHWLQTAVVASLLLVGAGMTSAAQETEPSHVDGGVRHGCPSDPGCADDADNQHRRGYNRVVDGVRMDFTMVAVYSVSALEELKTEYCWNCWRVDVEYDTGAQRECEFRTFHFVRDRVAGHYHYTTVGPC